MNSIAANALPDSCQNTFFHDVIAGLSEKQKTLPCKYFYDDEGARLFDQITHLSEYYPTRTELSILSDNAKSISACLPKSPVVIEPGCGSGEKVAFLLKSLESVKAFIPLEISTEMLQVTQARLQKRFPSVPIHALHGDFTHAPTITSLVAKHKLSNTANVVLFPGSTIGNFPAKASVGILNNLRLLAGDQGAVLLGIDLLKSEDRLIAAYDDAQGVTAKFNKNILVRINRELGADIKLKDFDHQAQFNHLESRVEMHLVANKSTQITLHDSQFVMGTGESIHTENAYKYTLDSLRALAADAGLLVEKTWQDANKDFAMCLLMPVGPSR